MHFGKPDEKVRKVYDLAANDETKNFRLLNPNVKFTDTLFWQKGGKHIKGFLKNGETISRKG